MKVEPQFGKTGTLIPTELVHSQRGSWKASDNFSKYNIKFEQLEEQHGERKYIEWTDDVRL